MLAENAWADLIIVSYNTRAKLKTCLESIRRQTDYPCRIWVIDNGSTDATRHLTRYFPGVRWVWNKSNPGYGRACNQGVGLSEGRYIIFLNSDTEMTPGWLSPLIAALDSDDQIALVGPKLLSPDGRIVGAGVVGTNASPVLRGWMEPDEAGRFGFAMECISLCGACLAVRRSTLSAIGLFDPTYFHYFEETDLCYRARQLGYRIVYEPKSRVIHHVSASCSNPRFLRDQFQRSRVYFETKWKEFFKDGRVYEEEPCGGFDRRQ